MSSGALVILSPGFPDGEADSACMPYLQMFVEALANAYPQVEIHLIAFQYPYVAREYSWKKVRVYALGGKNKKWNRFLTWRRALQLLEQLHAEKRIIGLLSLWLTECTYVAQKFLKRHNLPAVAWCIGQDAKKTNRYICRIDLSRFETVCMSPFLAEQLHLNHGIKIRYQLGNSINTSAIPLPETHKKEYDLVSVGTFSDFKQFRWVVEIMCELKKELPSIRACMVGGGPEYANIQNLVRQYGLEEAVTLTGSLSHEECLQRMMRSKILLHPSSFEGASTAILEALYYRCYVVSITVPAEDMPHTFYVVKDKQEMLEQTRALLAHKDNELSFCVNSSDDAARKLMGLLDYDK